MNSSAGLQLRQAMQKEKPLQMIGTINAYTAIMAKEIGFPALYLSGAGVANISYGLPDLGITTLDNVLEDATRILAAVDLPLLVDIDTGWGSTWSITRTIKSLIKAGTAGIHIEDQVYHKRCGHLPGKQLVSVEEMTDRIKAAVDAKTDPAFVIMARTDAYAVEGIENAIARAEAYKQAGAEMIFPESLSSLDQYRLFKDQLGLPILANITEFGKTPLFTLQELSQANVDIALYPLSATRAMNCAAFNIMREIRQTGTQKNSLTHMQTRDELYRFLGYKAYEKQINHKSVYNKGDPYDNDQ